MELLAPAGSLESLMAAIQAGADAVYFGVEQLNMRTRSSNNFLVEDLPEIAQRCKEQGIKAYLTLNTIIYDHDLSIMKRIVDEAKSSGIHAVIASDIAVMNYARKVGMAIHVSTQSNITNIDTIEFYANYADVMVLSRELTLMQVDALTREIARQNIIGPSGQLVRIEIFGHGALCMAVSGKCYLSLHSNFASANRGACIQNCRRAYVVTDKESGTELEIDNEYIMSAKDLCTIDFLDKIVDAGVAVLKIEGRGRSADYVYTTTRCYREALDALPQGQYTAEKIADWKARLATVYNRGFWEGYYLGRTMGEWNNEYGSQASKRKIYLGKGVKYYDEAKVAEFVLEAQSLKLGDEILVTGPNTGVIQQKISSLRVNGLDAQSVKRGENCTFSLNEKIRPSDKLYKIIDAE